MVLQFVELVYPLHCIPYKEHEAVKVLSILVYTILCTCMYRYVGAQPQTIHMIALFAHTGYSSVRREQSFEDHLQCGSLKITYDVAVLRRWMFLLSLPKVHNLLQTYLAVGVCWLRGLQFVQG